MKGFIMKKIVLFLLIATSLFAQNYQQNTGAVWNAWSHSYWITQKSGTDTEEYFLNIKAGDTLYSKIYFNAPGMCFFVTAADTNTANDSLKVKVNYLVSNYSDAAKFVYVKTLDFTHSESVVDQAYINAAGYWWSNISSDPYPAMIYYEIQVIALAGNRVKNDGVKLKFSTRFNTGY